MEKLNRILTGHRPTGPRHIGHLVGTLQTWKELQKSHQCFFLIADLHVLTTDFAHPAQIRRNIFEVVTDWLAAGIDPNQSALILQSAIPEHAQLSLLLSMLVSTARLERVPTYKEQIQQLGLTPTLGLFTYPVLMAADILVYQADTVPVGEDQLPHLELTREIARRFNQTYGELFPEPEALLSTAPRLPGIDNRTMHASYGNAIYLKDTPQETERKIMQMYTDPNRLHATDPGRVEGNPVFEYLDIFDPQPDELAEIKELYRLGKIGDVAVKERLVKAMNESLAPLRDRRQSLEAHQDEILQILQAGTQQARPIAQAIYQEAMSRMGLNTGQDLNSTTASTILTGIYC